MLSGAGNSRIDLSFSLLTVSNYACEVNTPVFCNTRCMQKGLMSIWKEDNGKCAVVSRQVSHLSSSSSLPFPIRRRHTAASSRLENMPEFSNTLVLSLYSESLHSRIQLKWERRMGKAYWNMPPREISGISRLFSHNLLVPWSSNLRDEKTGEIIILTIRDK